MATKKIRHLVERRGARGGVRYYWQPAAALAAEGWRPERLPDALESAIARAEALNADVDAWRRGEVAPNAPAPVKARARKHPAGSVAALIQDYRASRWWSKLAPKTRGDYGWALDAIEAWAGDMPARAITPPAVQAFYEGQLRRVEGTGRKRQVIETPAKAAAAVRVLRLLLGVGRRLGYLTSNPAERPGISLRRAREPVLWSPEAVRHMAEAADRLGWRSMGTAILLNEWIGQREGDVLRLPPWRVEADNLVIRQGKTGRLVSLPVHLVPHLVERLRAEAARRDAAKVVALPHADARAYLLLHEGTGERWNEHTFRHVFSAVRAAAATGIELREQIERDRSDLSDMSDLSRAGELANPPAQLTRFTLEPMPACGDLRFMELRHTAVTRLHEAGVDDNGIAGITGHTPASVRSILDRHYIVRTAKAAEGAFRKRLAAEGDQG